jgi:hypothetical protein
MRIDTRIGESPIKAGVSLKPDYVQDYKTPKAVRSRISSVQRMSRANFKH